MAKDLATYRLQPQGANLYKMVFGIGKLSKYVSGIQLLIQLVVTRIHRRSRSQSPLPMPIPFMSAHNPMAPTMVCIKPPMVQ